MNYENLAVGLTIFFIGLFKKLILADLIAAGYVHPVFDGVLKGRPFGLVACWGGALAYTLQLYFDFSGYSDMAIGLARILGIKLPINFDSPYKAVNIIDFWRRWHMTLSRFFRDYLYIPLGGNRRTPALTYLNLMVTMVLCGLWHGAGWTFVVWGGLHGLYLTINRLWRSLFESSQLSKLHGKREARIVSRLITFFCVVSGWAIFRSADMKSAMIMLKGMAGLNGLSLSQPDWQMWLSISFLLFIVWFCPNTQQIMGRFDPGFNVYKRDDQLIRVWQWIQWRPDWIWAIFLVFISGVGIATVVISNIREFLYFQF
jgi:D-alanyl-lipoteichoic acid acyltransferase DltB (MBOAT superfamily)